MTRMARRALGCCAAALLLHLTCVTAAQKLNNINDLRKIQFDQSVPRHSLQLLHWFANQVDIHPYGIRLNFNPHSDFGSHHYANSNGLLPYRPRGYQYYTVGNLNRTGAEELPNYVRYPQHDNNGNNRARIIFRAHEQTIDLVYLTQHYGNNQNSDYDPAHTYGISAGLLRELRQVSTRNLEQINNSRSQLQGNLGYSQALNIGRDRDPFYGYNYNQMPSYQHVSAAAGQSQGIDCIFDLVKWAFILIVMMAVVLIVLSLDMKSPHGY